MLPIAQAEFHRLMQRLEPWPESRRVAVAVSGGPDSLCLAWLTAGWGKPLALIVDHALRPDSAAEAREAATTLASFGVPSRILTLQGLSHGPGLAARARVARYDALAKAAREAGLIDLLLGHHAADQAETLVIRRASGSGPAGLAGMATVSEVRDLRRVRPLLGIPPGRLRATLRALGIGWAEDPSNQDTAATRARVRQHLADQDGAGAASAALVRDARAFGHERAAEEARLADRLAAAATLFPEGYALLGPGDHDPGMLAALIRMLSGSPYPPGGAALTQLAAAGWRGTLGGVRLMPAGRLGGGTLLVREAAAMQNAVPARQGVRWDGRFRLDADHDLPDGTTLGPLGGDARRFRTRSDLPSSVLVTLPALRDPRGLVAVPHLGYFKGWTNKRLRLRLDPATPAASASFLVCAEGDAQPAMSPHLPDDAAAHPGSPG